MLFDEKELNVFDDTDSKAYFQEIYSAIMSIVIINQK